MMTYCITCNSGHYSKIIIKNKKKQHCDKVPQEEVVTEVKFVGGGKGRKRSYGKMKEDV